MRFLAQRHATGIVLEGLGILIRGRSGAGKSLLALELLGAAKNAGSGGFLVGDDQVLLSEVNGRLIMGALPYSEGQIELRGRGIIERPFVKSATLHMVVDLVDQLVRMPEPEAFLCQLGSVDIPRCPVPERGMVDSAHQILLVHEGLNALGDDVGRLKSEEYMRNAGS